MDDTGDSTLAQRNGNANARVNGPESPRRYKRVTTPAGLLDPGLGLRGGVPLTEPVSVTLRLRNAARKTNFCQRGKEQMKTSIFRASRRLIGVTRENN